MTETDLDIAGGRHCLNLYRYSRGEMQWAQRHVSRTGNWQWFFWSDDAGVFRTHSVSAGDLRKVQEHYGTTNIPHVHYDPNTAHGL